MSGSLHLTDLETLRPYKLQVISRKADWENVSLALADTVILIQASLYDTFKICIRSRKRS